MDGFVVFVPLLIIKGKFYPNDGFIVGKMGPTEVVMEKTAAVSASGRLRVD